MILKWLERRANAEREQRDALIKARRVQDERTFAEALESALTEHADVWQALADLDAGKETKRQWK